MLLTVFWFMLKTARRCKDARSLVSSQPAKYVGSMLLIYKYISFIMLEHGRSRLI